MPTVSVRGNTVPVSAMRMFIPFADEAKARGIEVIPLNLGQPDIDTPAQFWEAVNEFPKNEPALGYAPSRGRPELVTAIVTYCEFWTGGFCLLCAHMNCCFLRLKKRNRRRALRLPHRGGGGHCRLRRWV